MKESFEVAKQTTSQNIYPGYPEKRLVVEDLDTLRHMTLPDGEWSTDSKDLPSLEKQQWLKEQGYILDDLGRPLHPWLNDMLTNPEVGVVTGRGEYWNWGPNRTADPIILSGGNEPKVLLIKRGDNGNWALPGGFVDAGETGVEAAKRELGEEASLSIVGEPLLIYDGVVADSRTTAHAWPETTALLWKVEGTPKVNAADGELDAVWFPISELPDRLHGSHAVMIEQAIAKLDSLQPSHAFSLPPSTESYSRVNGGHMTYHRVIARTTDGFKHFIKSHDKNAFTDSIREAHSLQYLRKEKLMYDHLQKHGFENSPQDVNLVNGHDLTMQAFDTDEGWHWRAPSDKLDAYIHDVFRAIEQLESIPLLDDFCDTEGATTNLLLNQGWAQMTQEDLSNIVKKLEILSPKLDTLFQQSALTLSQNLNRHRDLALEPRHQKPTKLVHHDFRQSNLAWHPEHGVKIIDWSWAGAGYENSDRTMLLIDLNKSGHNVSEYLHYFNPTHARDLIGYWLACSLREPNNPESTVRFHQMVSAVAAYDMLLEYGQR